MGLNPLAIALELASQGASQSSANANGGHDMTGGGISKLAMGLSATKAPTGSLNTPINGADHLPNFSPLTPDGGFYGHNDVVKAIRGREVDVIGDGENAGPDCLSKVDSVIMSNIPDKAKG